MKLVFQNKGVIDLRSIKTFGMSAKSNESAIGMFGTGLKYAIAIFLRENHELTLVADGEAYSFQKKEIEVRGKRFEVLTMNGEELPFTTHLGFGWKLWQGFREVYCNCIDEGGSVYMTDSANFEKGNTYFVVDGPEAETLFDARDEIVLPEEKKGITVGTDLKVYRQNSKSLFYKGIRAYELPAQSLFCYNILQQMELTEDRTIKNPHSALRTIAREVGRMTDSNMIRQILTAQDGYLETAFDFDVLMYSFESTSVEFKGVISKLYYENHDRLNNTARTLFRGTLNEKTPRHYEEIQLDSIQEQQLEKAKKIVAKAYPASKKYPIKIVSTLGSSVYGLADGDEQMIVLSVKCFSLGTKFLVSTLLEEFIHLETGHADMTRSLQTFLFDELTTMIEKFIVKEPI